MDEPHRGGRHQSYWSYVHDKWQIHPSITLDLGLRHEYYTPLVGFHGKGGMVTYNPETNQLLVAGYGNIPENLGVASYWKNFAPRTGISWRLNDATVLRGVMA
jgi:outer membrane receptor protein involved in Fe transport